jgi:DNA-binding NarL/FixJ family response regulator
LEEDAQGLRVVLADDHAVYRQGLVGLLAERGIEVVGQASNGEQAVAMVQDLAPDVVVMDLNMPALSGLEATQLLSVRTPATKVVVLTVSSEAADVTDAIVAGASGYILKDAPVDEIVGGIRAAAAGEALISPRIAGNLLDRIRERNESEPVHPAVALSKRELEVLKLVADGMGNPEIGEALFIGRSTVRNHISNILMKLQVENRVQAAVRAVRDHIV